MKILKSAFKLASKVTTPLEIKLMNKAITLMELQTKLKKLGPKSPWWADITLVSKKLIKDVNLRFRNKNKVTDVLSFPADPVFRTCGFLGELIICKSKVKIQASEHGLNFDEELMVLIIHGLLHLLGFDHERSLKEAKDMAKWEKRLLDKSNYNRPQGLIERTQVKKGLKNKRTPRFSKKTLLKSNLKQNESLSCSLKTKTKVKTKIKVKGKLEIKVKTMKKKKKKEPKR